MNNVITIFTMRKLRITRTKEVSQFLKQKVGSQNSKQTNLNLIAMLC